MIYNDPAFWPRKSKEQYDPFLTFCSPNTFAISATHQGWDGTLEYSWDKTDWTTWDGSSVVAEFPDELYVLYFRGTGNTHISPSWGWGQWTITGEDVRCIGNIETLLDYSTVVAGEHPPMAENCYHAMFKDCDALTQAPALPAVTLANSCYFFMFYECSNLIQIPRLPATTLVDGCYNSMFFKCRNIKLHTSKNEDFKQAYRIPTAGTGTTASDALTDMFAETGGGFTGTPEINTTYYLSSSNTIV